MQRIQLTSSHGPLSAGDESAWVVSLPAVRIQEMRQRKLPIYRALLHVDLAWAMLSEPERLPSRVGQQRCSWQSGRSLITLGVMVVFSLLFLGGLTPHSRAGEVTFRVTADRGEDLGQSFGSLFEVTSQDGSLVIGAGFQNGYNTRLRADRHAIQFFVRPADGQRTIAVEMLPRPNELCGTYLSCRDEVVSSTYGGLKAWDESKRAWRAETEIGGTQESLRVGNEILEFGDSMVKYAGKPILMPPSRGTYQLFFYAHGYLCFYHVDRGEGGYRPYVNDSDGFSRLYACPWSPAQSQVDLTRAKTLTLPVVGETTFAWGQSGTNIVTGSNIGGFYCFENGQWTKLLEPNLRVSYQLYSTQVFYDRLLMGQYPTGRLFAFKGDTVTDQADWPPVPPGVTSSAREAQTTVIFGGELFVGVWPWGELWRYRPDSQSWTLVQRMFSHPELNDKIVHPYDIENRGHEISNLWGQRVTSLVTSGTGLYVSTSAKYPCEWDADRYPFLAPDRWQAYGAVYRLTMPGHLGAKTAWTTGASLFEFSIRDATLSIQQDGRTLATTVVSGPLGDQLRRTTQWKPTAWGNGIYGRFTGPRLEGQRMP